MVGEAATYRGEVADPEALQLTTEGYTLRPTTLRASDTGAEISVGGTVRFPQIDLPAGRPTPIPEPVRTRDIAETEVEFGADGSFRIKSQNSFGGMFQITGRWRDLGGGRIEVDFGAFVPVGGSPPTGPTARAATVRLRDGRLAFFLADAPADGRIDLAETEGYFHAAPGTFEAATPGVLYDLRRVTE